MKYRKKPIVIEAVKWTGVNNNEVSEFMKHYPKIVDRTVRIKTLEGNIYASEGDFIIQGVSGEFYPCKPDIFHKTYDEVKT